MHKHTEVYHVINVSLDLQVLKKTGFAGKAACDMKAGSGPLVITRRHRKGACQRAMATERGHAKEPWPYIQFTAVQEQPEIAKNEVLCVIHREMYVFGCNRHLLFSQSRNVRA